MQPVLTQVPPKNLRSMIPTFIPASTRRAASAGPACPPPMTIASNSCIFRPPGLPEGIVHDNDRVKSPTTPRQRSDSRHRQQQEGHGAFKFRCRFEGARKIGWRVPRSMAPRPTEATFPFQILYVVGIPI